MQFESYIGLICFWIAGLFGLMSLGGARVIMEGARDIAEVRKRLWTGSSFDRFVNCVRIILRWASGIAILIAALLVILSTSISAHRLTATFSQLARILLLLSIFVIPMLVFLPMSPWIYRRWLHPLPAWMKWPEMVVLVLLATSYIFYWTGTALTS